MISRLTYALKQTWLQRRALLRYTSDPSVQIETVLALDVVELKSTGIQSLILDFDGVLASHGEDTLQLSVQEWLTACVMTFGAHNVYVLSNRPTEERQKYFSTYFKEVTFFISTQKKPYPDGLFEILLITKKTAESTLLVDDRLLTGILAAAIAQVPALYVTKPQVCIKNRPVQELFFMGLRQVDRWIIWLFNLWR